MVRHPNDLALNGTPRLTMEQTLRYRVICSDLEASAARRGELTASKRAAIYEAFFGKQPGVKRGRGQRRNRR